MKKFGVKLILFGILFLVLLWGISGLFARNFRHEPDMGATEAFYKLEENSLDALFVGSSHCYCGFDPRILLNEYGISAYNLATGNQTMLANYLWAKEAYRTQKYKVLVVEAYSLYTVSENETALHLKSLYAMRPSRTYFEYAEHVGKKELLTLAFPIFELHDQWPMLSKEAFLPLKDELLENRGYYTVTEDTEAGDQYNYSVLKENTDEKDTVVDTKRMDDIREFCDRNGIQMVCVKSVIADNSENIWNDLRHNAVQAYCSQYDIPFIDFNASYYMEKAGLQPGKDVSADRCHSNKHGAEKQSVWLGEYLDDLLSGSSS